MTPEKQKLYNDKTKIFFERFLVLLERGPMIPYSDQLLMKQFSELMLDEFHGEKR